MQVRTSMFATHKGAKTKRALKWVGGAAVIFVVANHMLGGGGAAVDAATTTVFGADASHYGVRPGGLPDADQSAIAERQSSGDILNSDDSKAKLVVAGFPANPFRGASSAASGPESGSRLTINVPGSSGSDDDDNTATTAGESSDSSPDESSSDASENTGDDAASAASPSDESSPSDGAAAPTGSVFDGLPDGDGSGSGPSTAASSESGLPDSADDKAAASAAVAFITAYTNYSATSTTADKFTQDLPNLTPDTRQQIKSQTAQQWDRLNRDQRVSQGKVVGQPSLSVPAKDGKAIVVVDMSIAERGETTNTSYRSRYTITMVQSNNEWLVDGVTAQDN